MIRFSIVAIVLVGLAACDRDEPLGRVSVALSEDQCDDYCLETLRATLYAEGAVDLPIGPPVQVACGAEITFAALPAGERVLVTLQAFDVTGEVLLDGTSEALTIIANGVAEARIRLVEQSIPALNDIEPDPVVVADGPATVTLTGGFGPPLGKAAVEVGGVSYGDDAWDWVVGDAKDMITLTLPAGAPGGSILVRTCGVPSVARELRVIGATAGQSPVLAPAGCSDAVAAVPLADGVLIAWRCGTGGVLARMRIDDALCPLDPGASWPLADPPEALALSGSRAFVGGPGGLVEIDIDATGAPIDRGVDEHVLALAASATEAFALLRSGNGPVRLAKLSDAGLTDVAGVDDSWTLTAIAGPDFFVAAHVPDGEGRLIHILPTGVVGTISLVDGSNACPRPSALAVAGDGVVIACADGGIATWDLIGAGLDLVTTQDPVDAFAFDAGEDVVYALGAGSLTIVDRFDLAVTHRFAFVAPPAGRPSLLVALSAHRLLATAADAPLMMLTPFDTAGPCPVGATTP